MMENKYSTQPQTETSIAKERVSTPQKLLLIGALIIGICFRLVFLSSNEGGEAIAAYFMSWVVYGSVFLLFNHAKTKQRPYTYVYLAIAFYLCVISPVQFRGYSEDSLVFLNLAAVPLLLMVHAQLVMGSMQFDSFFKCAMAVISGFFVQSFKDIPKFFSAIASLFNKKNSGVIIGTAIALPLGIIVLSLLLEADAVMGSFAAELLRDFDLWVLFTTVLMVLIISALFYSFLYGATWGDNTLSDEQDKPKWTPLIMRIVLISLLVIYAVFIFVQFVYLFGGHGLPRDLTYSQYAREGFNQLIWVLIINISLYAVSLARFEMDKLLKVLLSALMLCCIVILASACTRLGLYIGAYGLTFKRILAAWLFIYLGFTLILCGLRLFNKKVPLLAIGFSAFCIWYAILNIVDLRLFLA